MNRIFLTMGKQSISESSFRRKPESMEPKTPDAGILQHDGHFKKSYCMAILPVSFALITIFNFMTKIAKAGLLIVSVAAVLVASYHLVTRISFDSEIATESQIDSLNGVAIFHNGGVNASYGRNLTKDGYNLGIKYQCVEFVKRYYFERFAHRMPDAYGHARSFFDQTVADGAPNAQRGLIQFRNGSRSAPRPDDILVFGPGLFNPYGHVAIVAEVNPHAVVVAQQNPGPLGSSREAFPLLPGDGEYRIADNRVLGWLRMPDKTDHAARER